MQLKTLIDQLPKHTRTIITAGARESGKDVTTHQIARLLHNETGKNIHINLKPEKYNLPSYFRKVNLEKIENGGIIMLTDAELEYYSTEWHTPKVEALMKIEAISRHKELDFLYTTLETTELPYNLIRKADAIVFKEPIWKSSEHERPFIRDEAEQARVYFFGQTQKWKWQHALVFTQKGRFEIEDIRKPYYWSEELSKCMADLTYSTAKPTPAVLKITRS